MSSRLDRVGKLLGSGVDIYSNSFIGLEDRQRCWRLGRRSEEDERERREKQRSTGVEEGYDMEP